MLPEKRLCRSSSLDMFSSSAPERGFASRLGGCHGCKRIDGFRDSSAFLRHVLIPSIVDTMSNNSMAGQDSTGVCQKSQVLRCGGERLEASTSRLRGSKRG